MQPESLSQMMEIQLRQMNRLLERQGLKPYLNVSDYQRRRSHFLSLLKISIGSDGRYSTSLMGELERLHEQGYMREERESSKEGGTLTPEEEEAIKQAILEAIKNGEIGFGLEPAEREEDGIGGQGISLTPEDLRSIGI